MTNASVWIKQIAQHSFRHITQNNTVQ